MSILGSLVRQAMDARLAGVHTNIPGVVVRYNATTRRAAVQPLIRRVYTDEAGEKQTEQLPVVTEVPVIFPGSDASHARWDVLPGDTVWLEFSEASLDRWLASGSKRPVDPGDPRRHALSDAVAFPGLLQSASDHAAMIFFQRQPTPQVRLGSPGASDGVLLGDAFLNALGTLLGTIKTQIGTISGGGSAAAGVIETAIESFEGAVATYLSSKVKVE